MPGRILGHECGRKCFQNQGHFQMDAELKTASIRKCPEGFWDTNVAENASRTRGIFGWMRNLNRRFHKDE